METRAVRQSHWIGGRWSGRGHFRSGRGGCPRSSRLWHSGRDAEQGCSVGSRDGDQSETPTTSRRCVLPVGSKRRQGMTGGTEEEVLKWLVLERWSTEVIFTHR